MPAALKARKVRHRDLGITLVAVSGHLRRSDDDRLEGLFEESSFLICKLIVNAYSFARFLPAFC